MDLPSAPSMPAHTRVWTTRTAAQRGLHRLAVGLLLFSIPMMFVRVLAVFPEGLAEGVGAMLVAASALSVVVATMLGAESAPTVCAVSLVPGGLRMQGPRGDTFLRTEDLRDGMVLWDLGGWMLELRTRDGDTHRFDMPDKPTADAWLSSLGLDASHRALTIVSNRRGIQALLGYFMTYPVMIPMAVALGMFTELLRHFGVAVRHGLSPAFVFALMGLGLWASFRTVGHVTMTLGLDGVRFSRGVQTHFLKLDEIESADSDGENELRFFLRGAPRAMLFKFASRALCQAALARFWAVRQAHANATAPDALERLTAPAERTAEAWREVFVAAVRQGSYRGVSLTLDELTEVVSAVAATPEQRVGAALALRELSPTEGASRVRVAREALADPATETLLATTEAEAMGATLRR